MNKTFQELFLDNPVFRLVAVLKPINKIFEKELQKNLFLMEMILNLSTKSLKKPAKNFAF